MKFSVMTEPQLGGTYQDLLAVARFAEQAGMVSFARSDHYHWTDGTPRDATDAFATLGGLARETSTIRLCVLVTPVTFRHPAVIAKNAATIDQMSGGRLDLGVGTGWMEAEHEALGLPFPPRAERFERLEETLGYLEAAFGSGQFTGMHYRLETDVRPKPIGTRIVLGGTGPRRTPTLAGRWADEYNHIVAPLSDIRPKIEIMRGAAEEAGRDPDRIEVTMMGRVLTGRDPTEYRRNLEEAAGRRGEDPTALETRLADAGVPLGPPERIGEAFARLAEAGVSRYYLQWFDLSDLAGLEATWEAVRATSR